MNIVILAGRLGADPDFSYTKTNTPRASFSLATVESYKDSTGKKISKTEWHKVIAWGNLAVVVNEYLKKGSHVHVVGSIETSVWYTADGEEKKAKQIKADKVEFGPNNKSDSTSEEQTIQNPISEDDIPF